MESNKEEKKLVEEIVNLGDKASKLEENEDNKVMLIIHKVSIKERLRRLISLRQSKIGSPIKFVVEGILYSKIRSVEEFDRWFLRLLENK